MFRDMEIFTSAKVSPVGVQWLWLPAKIATAWLTPFSHNDNINDNANQMNQWQWQCPMPNAQCPMPNAQCPMPNAQCHCHWHCQWQWHCHWHCGTPRGGITAPRWDNGAEVALPTTRIDRMVDSRCGTPWAVAWAWPWAQPGAVCMKDQ